VHLGEPALDRVRLSEYGAPVWPNGLELAPDALYERIRLAASATHVGRSSYAKRQCDFGRSDPQNPAPQGARTQSNLWR